MILIEGLMISKFLYSQFKMILCSFYYSQQYMKRMRQMNEEELVSILIIILEIWRIIGFIFHRYKRINQFY